MKWKLAILLMLLGCENSDPTMIGENNTLIFSTTTNNIDQTPWQMNEPIATKSQFDILISSWVLFTHDDPSGFTEFATHYNTEDIDAIKHLLLQEEFLFSSPLTILQTATNQSSKTHRGSATFTAANEGIYTITATGIKTDVIKVEIADPIRWKVFPYFGLEWWNGFKLWDSPISLEALSSFCVYPNASMRFYPQLFDAQNRKLSGQIPDIEISADNKEINVRTTSNMFELVTTDITSDAHLHFTAKNVYGESLYSFPDIDVCVAKNTDIQDVDIKILHETIENIDAYKINEDTLPQTKEAKRLAKQYAKANNVRYVLITPVIKSDKKIPNLPIDISVHGGIVMDVNMFGKTPNPFKDPDIHSTVTTNPDLPLLIIFPNNKEIHLTIKAVGIVKKQTIPKFIPDTPTEIPVSD